MNHLARGALISTIRLDCVKGNKVKALLLLMKARLEHNVALASRLTLNQLNAWLWTALVYWAKQENREALPRWIEIQ